MGRFLARTTAAASLGILWVLSLPSSAVAQTTPPSTNGNVFESFDFDPFRGFPGSATRVMHDVLVGIIIVFALTLIVLVVFRGRTDNSSSFRRSGS